MPDFRPAKQRKTDVPAQVQAIAVCNHSAAISLAGLRVVEGAILRMGRVDRLEVATNTQTAQWVMAEFGIRIVYVILMWGGGGWLYECRADEGPAGLDTDDGVIWRRPVADHLVGGICTARQEEQDG
jgi:hypothetical protein